MFKNDYFEKVEDQQQLKTTTLQEVISNVFSVSKGILKFVLEGQQYLDSINKAGFFITILK